MRSKLNLWLAIVLLVLVPIIARGQDTTAKIHGHVQDPANAPIANGQVVLSKDGKTALFTFTTDANGDYKGEGIKPDTYYVTLYATPGKAVDRDCLHAPGRGCWRRVRCGCADGRGQDRLPRCPG